MVLLENLNRRGVGNLGVFCNLNSVNKETVKMSRSGVQDLRFFAIVENVAFVTGRGIHVGLLQDRYSVGID